MSNFLRCECYLPAVAFQVSLEGGRVQRPGGLTTPAQCPADGFNRRLNVPGSLPIYEPGRVLIRPEDVFLVEVAVADGPPAPERLPRFL